MIRQYLDLLDTEERSFVLLHAESDALYPGAYGVDYGKSCLVGTAALSNEDRCSVVYTAAFMKADTLKRWSSLLNTHMPVEHRFDSLIFRFGRARINRLIAQYLRRANILSAAQEGTTPEPQALAQR